MSQSSSVPIHKSNSLIREHWGIILITALAALFRFSFFDLSPYYYDQSYPAFQALKILEEGRFPTTSIYTLLGLPNPPIMSYIQTIPLLFSRSPLAVVIFISFLNLLAIPLTYFLALRLFEQKTALAASFLYAIAPMATEFSRTAWVQGLLPFFTALVTYLLFPTLAEKRNEDRRVFTALALTALMTQSYLLAYAAVAQVGLLLLAFRKHLNWRPVLAGLIFFLLVSLPYVFSILGQLSKTPQGLQEFLAGPWALDGQAIGSVLHLIAGTFADNLAVKFTQGVITLLLLIGIGVGLLRLLKQHFSENYFVLLAWFFTPIALLTIHSRPIYPWYMLLTLPAGFILAGHGASFFWRGHLRVAAMIVAVGLILVFTNDIFVRYQEEAAGLNIDRTGLPPLRYSLSLGQVVRETSREVYIQASQPWISAVSGTLINPYQNFDPSRFLVIPANRPALYILLDPKDLSPAFTFAQELIDKTINLPNDGSICFFLFPARSREELSRLPSHPLDLKFDIGWRLLGYDLPDGASPGEEVKFTTYWLIEDLLAGRETLFYGPFVHLLDAKGNAVVISGGHGQAGYLWRQDELFIDTAKITIPADLPPGDYWIYTGLFDPNSSLRAHLEDGRDHILLGPLRIE